MKSLESEGKVRKLHELIELSSNKVDLSVFNLQLLQLKRLAESRRLRDSRKAHESIAKTQLSVDFKLESFCYNKEYEAITHSEHKLQLKHPQQTSPIVPELTAFPSPHHLGGKLESLIKKELIIIAQIKFIVANEKFLRPFLLY